MTAKAKIAQAAIELLAREPAGLHHSVLVQKLRTMLPEIPANTVRGSVVGLSEYKPAEIHKPAKGLFQHAMYSEPAGSPELADCSPSTVQVREQDFYASFAEYLTEDLEECTKKRCMLQQNPCVGSRPQNSARRRGFDMRMHSHRHGGREYSF